MRGQQAGLGCGRGVEGSGVGARLHRDTTVLPPSLRLLSSLAIPVPLTESALGREHVVSENLQQSEGARSKKGEDNRARRCHESWLLLL